MKKLLVFIFCSLYTFVLLAQNRITTDTVGMLHMGAGNITLLELDTVSRSGRSPVVIRRDTTAFEMIYIDSLLPAPVGKPQVLSASLSAGRTEATLDVSASGGATYTIPFALPPGINGVVPQLGLAYNSQGGNGMAGYGWNIYGLSSITRIGAAKYSDGRTGGINLDTTDRFALDGQRLLLKSGIYGDDGAEYQTEQYSNIRIISKGISPIGTEYTPEYFEVYYPDGSFALYGVREIDGYNNPFSEMEYALNYIENPQGIRIAYTYSIHGNQLYVTKVRYGSRGETAGINEVQFEYTTKNRAELRYVGGARLESNRLLSKVSVIANGIPYRHYLPSYDSVATLGYDRMIKIQELDGSENHAFEPILFGYETTDNLVTTSTIPDLSPPGIASNNYYVVTADFTGNGTMDFLLCPHTKDKFYFF